MAVEMQAHYRPPHDHARDAPMRIKKAARIGRNESGSADPLAMDQRVA